MQLDFFVKKKSHKSDKLITFSSIMHDQILDNLGGIMLRIMEEALTYDDVLLVPAHSTVLPNTADLRTRLTSNI